MCIYLSCRQGLMTEQLLHSRDVGAIVKHVGGEGVAQHVGRALLSRHAALKGVMDNCIDQLTIELLTIRPDEKIFCLVRSDCFGSQLSVVND